MAPSVFEGYWFFILAKMFSLLQFSKGKVDSCSSKKKTLCGTLSRNPAIIKPDNSHGQAQAGELLLLNISGLSACLRPDQWCLSGHKTGVCS